MRDLHIHTKFSCDSEAQPEEYILKALTDGCKEICFTDHVDLNPNDYGYNYYSTEMFFSCYDALKEKYSEKINVLAGIEFGEPHLYYEKLQELSKYPYDFIIGSIHWVGSMFPCKEVREQYTAKEFYMLYWKEVLKTVKAGGFDSLGHIDFPKRYYGETYYTEEMINEIFKYLLDHNSVIEINTSSLRKGHTETMPDRELLEIYKANGGKYVTVGSDAHVVEDLGAVYERASALLSEIGLQEVVYKKRKCIVV